MRILANILMRVVGVAVVVAVLAVLVPNVGMWATQAPKIKSAEDVAAEPAVLDEDLQAGQVSTGGVQSAYDAILVLGAAVRADGTPSTILADRIQVAAELYFAGVAPKIIMSGDNQSDRAKYDEVTNMKRYAVEELGVPAEDVFCDHAGINTYDSMYRARHVFGVQRLVVVTQTYHLYRALADATSFHMEARGVPADLHEYANQAWYDVRECGARVSDCWKIITRAQATYLSEPVSLDQSGEVTTWQYSE